MNKQFMRFTMVVAVCATALANAPLSAQTVSKTAGPSDFQLQLRNLKQTDDKTLIFDLFIVRTGKNVPIEIATFQAGIEYNKEILNGAEVKADMVTIVPGSSELSDSLKPKMINASLPGLIRLAGRPAPRKTGGTVLPDGEKGLRICTIKFSNSVPFAAGVSPELKFTTNAFVKNSYASRLGIFGDKKIIQLDILPGKNAVCNEHIQLNPTK
ncbi:MAG: hypothetical protein JNL22_04390 [Bacteroidales bacterium]|nr:hypothetical protein [Bacteroidales bacterium]